MDSNVYVFRTKPDNMTADELAKLFILMYSFENSAQEHPDATYMKLHTVLESNNIKVSELVEELTPSCLEVLERCIWKGTQTRCDSLFQRINTAKGPCCSFNYYGLKTNRYAA